MCKVCEVEPCLALTLLSQPLSAKPGEPLSTKLGDLAAASSLSAEKEDSDQKVCSINLYLCWRMKL